MLWNSSYYITSATITSTAKPSPTSTHHKIADFGYAHHIPERRSSIQEICRICSCTVSYFIRKISQGRGKIHFRTVWSCTHRALIRPTIESLKHKSISMYTSWNYCTHLCNVAIDSGSTTLLKVLLTQYQYILCGHLVFAFVNCSYGTLRFYTWYSKAHQILSWLV